jgi:hypothetical protein
MKAKITILEESSPSIEAEAYALRVFGLKNMVSRK